MTKRRLGDALHAAIRPEAVPRADETFNGPNWPRVVGALGGIALTLGAVLVLFSGAAQQRSFMVLIAAGILLGVAWSECFRHGFGNVASILGCFAIPCGIALMVSYHLPQLPDAWAKDYADVADAAWASIDRALRLKVFLLLAPFVVFFAGLLSLRKLGHLRTVAGLGMVATIIEAIMTLENARRWARLYDIAGIAMFGTVAITGAWLAVVFLRLRRDTRRRAAAAG